MSKHLTIIRPTDENNPESPRFIKLMKYVSEQCEYTCIRTAPELLNWLSFKKKEDTGSLLLFAVFIGKTGINITLYQMLQMLRGFGEDCLSGCVGGVVIDGGTDLYTRTQGREILLTANMLGCTFPGKPLVEGTHSLLNFDIIASNLGLNYEKAYFSTAKNLVKQILNFNAPKWKKPSILTLHASNHETSNTLAYWSLIREYLPDSAIQEIHIENGSVVDCTGCPYKMCLHYAKQDKCFYGGVMVEEIYPAISECNILVLLCPNYNDAVSANISAFINRLTALFRKTPFYDKYVYALIVSGYSGSDIVAQQIISALNINKAFILPPKFAAMETANSAGSLLGITGIEERAAYFASRILGQNI